MKLPKILLMILVVTGITFTGCKKEKTTDPKPESTTSLQKLSRDEQNFEDVSDEALNDATQVLSGNNGLKSTMMPPCNATVDSAVVANDSITYYITYNGNNCSNTRFREGQITVTKKVGEYWITPGATTIVRMINFHIVKLATNHSVTLNGTKHFQNVSGGVFWQLGTSLTSIVQKVWGSVEATFDDNTSRTWNIARQRTITGTLTNLVITIDGFGTSGIYNNLVVWGTNRDGEAFYTTIQQSVVLKQSCGWDPCSGIKKHELPVADKSATLTFGYNANGQPVTGVECPTYYRLDWQKGNNSGTLYLPLP